MTDNLSWLTATELADDVRRGQISASEVAEHFVGRVESVNPTINAIVDFDREQVLSDARALDEKLGGGESVGPLHGVPFTIKDLTAVAGRPLTFGMVPMKDSIADHDAVIVRRLKAAGGLYLGKTNTPESGYYGGTDNHLFGPTHNPWKRGYSAGGSSGGAAAAVAAGLGPLAEGSDGAGSVRIPASLCGVVGLKPSTGRVPQTILAGRFYHWAYHGPITRTVEDNALMLGVVAGPDESDPLSLPASDTDYVAETRKDIAGWRIAWSPRPGLRDGRSGGGGDLRGGRPGVRGPRSPGRGGDPRLGRPGRSDVARHLGSRIRGRTRHARLGRVAGPGGRQSRRTDA